MRYVYPVVSRRAGGVSIGINLNPNNACNWHCAYCQVPNLVRGSSPEIDLIQLKHELLEMLNALIEGDFMQEKVPEGCRQLCDLAISGNGEPTSCQNFDAIVASIAKVMQHFDLTGKIPLRLISNGSYVHKAHVQRGLQLIADLGGEVWMKVDAATEVAIARINGVHATPALLLKQVQAAAQVCPTWIQTCMMAWDEKPPSHDEVTAYLHLLRLLQQSATPLQGVLLYGVARPSLQESSQHVSPLSHAWMQTLKDDIEALGFCVKLSL